MRKYFISLIMIVLALNINAQSWGSLTVWEDEPAVIKTENKLTTKADTTSVLVNDTSKVVNLFKQTTTTKSDTLFVRSSFEELYSKKTLSVSDSLQAMDHVNLLVIGFVVELYFKRANKTLYVLQHKSAPSPVRIIPSEIEKPYFDNGTATDVLGVYAPTKTEVKHGLSIESVSQKVNYQIEVTTSPNLIKLKITKVGGKHEYEKTWSF